MLMIPQEVEMKWHPRYRIYYEERGYKFTKYRDLFNVDVRDLPNNSQKKVWVLCDYCLEKGVERKRAKTFQTYIKQNRESIIKKDCCYECTPIKIKESNMITYGVESTNQLKEIRKKQEDTNMQRYGGKSPMSDLSIRKKVEGTNRLRYGTKTPAQNTLIKEKAKVTCIEKYGFVSPAQNLDVMKKQIETNMKKYSVPFTLMNEGVKIKARESLYKNGSVPTSRQQLYINSILKGELNYPFKNYSLDIAFPQKKIYVECDFGGHLLQIKLGSKTREEFEKEERKRWYALYRNGWKEIRIISEKDKVPAEEKIIEIFDYACSHLNSGHTWIRFYIDNQKLIYNERGEIREEEFNFGDLSYIYK